VPVTVRLKSDLAESRSLIGEHVCREVVQHCTGLYGTQLVSIVLTGSMARQESTLVLESGEYQVLGDAEFLLVFYKSFPLPGRSGLAELRSNITSSLLCKGIRCSISLAAVHPNYFRELPAHIFSYELRNCARVVWGAPGSLQLIPLFTPAELALEDAWQLLCNRMVEQLAVVPALPSKADRLPAPVFYRTVKLYLDSATSFLVFAGAYAPTYAGRAKALSALARDASRQDDPLDVQQFAKRVEQCTAWKLTPAREGPAPTREFWEDGIRYAYLLWVWELKRLTGTTAQLSSRDLLEKWRHQQPLYCRLRGWAYVLRRRRWREAFRLLPRCLRGALHSAPRHSVYAAASELFFRLPSLLVSGASQPPEVDWADVRRNLPVVCEFSKGSDWRQLASDIVWNYQEFLVETRA
jgi:hypothetical protein